MYSETCLHRELDLTCKEETASVWSALTGKYTYVLITPNEHKRKENDPFKSGDMMTITADAFLTLCQSLFAVPEKPECKDAAVNTDEPPIVVHTGINTDNPEVDHKGTSTDELITVSTETQTNPVKISTASTVNKHSMTRIPVAHTRTQTVTEDNLSKHRNERETQRRRMRGSTSASTTHSKVQSRSNDRSLPPQEELKSTLLSVKERIRHIKVKEYLPQSCKDKELEEVDPLAYLEAYLTLLYDFVKFSVGSQEAVRKLVKRYLCHLLILVACFEKKEKPNSEIIKEDQTSVSKCLAKGLWSFEVHSTSSNAPVSTTKSPKRKVTIADSYIKAPRTSSAELIKQEESPAPNKRSRCDDSFKPEPIPTDDSFKPEPIPTRVTTANRVGFDGQRYSMEHIRTDMICRNYNVGVCHKAQCYYDHICIACHGPHAGMVCHLFANQSGADPRNQYNQHTCSNHDNQHQY